MIFQKTISPLKIILIVVLSLLAFSGAAQIKNVTISGTVKDSISNAALPYVNIIIKSKDEVLKVGTVTNEEGIFTIENIHPGNYTLEISSIGNVTKKTKLFVG